MEQVLILACLLCLTSDLISAGESVNYSCEDCITISSKYGHDRLTCLQRNTSSNSSCQSLTYVFGNYSSLLNDREVLLQGHYWLNETLTVSGVNGLTIRGTGNSTSAIKCPYPQNSAHEGYGLVFEHVSGLRISNVRFEGCGTLQNSTTLRDGVSIKYRSAVYIISSTDIQLTGTNFHRNIGKGLSLHDVDGEVTISSSTFRENTVPPIELFGGGSIYIEFTYCPPGEPACEPETNSHNKHSRYLVKNCIFEGNSATNGEFVSQSHIVQFSIFDGKNAGQGGGLHLIIRGMSLNNSFLVDNCTFYNNSGVFGGGIDVLFLDNAHNNSFHVANSIFENNYAPHRGGGALQLGFYGIDSVTHNSIHIQGTVFTNNTAGWGAAVAYFSSLSKINVQNSLTFIDCVFEGNSASIGAAIALKPSALQSIHDGSTPTALFRNCTFARNQILLSGTFLNIANDGLSQHVLESGILDIASSKVDFSEYMSFVDNSGSAVVANSGQINVLESSQVVFLNNTATNGGAMALLGFSVLELHAGSRVVFESNNASELGGAVYATSPNQLEFIISHKCFISFRGMNSNDPDKWNATLIFTNNSARYGYAIFTDSVLPCVKQIGKLFTNISAAFRWKSFKITPDIEQYTIATSPAAINFTVPPEISPGESIYLNLTSLDDLDQPIPSSFKVTLDSIGGDATTNAFVSEDGHLQITGDPGTNFNLTLLTQNTRHVSATNPGRLDGCPLGFILDKDTCVCSTRTPAKLFGVVGCDTVNFQALLQIGYWIGCSAESKPVTGICPLSYCNYDDYSETGILPVPRTCEDLSQFSLCNEHRTGRMCGECADGYSAYFHSEKFSCGECPYGALGLLVYIVAELLPLFAVFALVMSFKVNITSGLMQSFLFFAQTFFILNHIPSLRPLSRVTLTFISIHTLIVGFFNMYFFHMDEMSFCLWRGATILDTIAFRYVTTLFTILLLGLFILAVKQRMVHTESIATQCAVFDKIKNIAKKMKFHKNSIIHGISAFLILSYTQYTLTSFQLLIQIPVYGEGVIVDQSVVYLQGSLEYFGLDHLPYAIPAVLVLIFLSLPPPLLLIAYPLLWNIKAKLRQNSGTGDDTTIWPIRKLLPLIDSFQGVFRDNCRMFAGLLFLWRFILTAIYSFASTITEFFLLTEIAVLIIFAIHALVRPYKQLIHNIIDGVMLVNVALIILLKWYTSVPSTDSISESAIDFLIALQLLLMYIPLVGLGGYAVYCLLRWLKIIPEKISCSVFKKVELNKKDSDVPTAASAKNVTLKKQAASADEELFSRAAELNKFSSVERNITCTEVFGDIATSDTTCTTLSSK